MGLVPQGSCLLSTFMPPHCCASVCEVLLQTSPHFLQQRWEGCLNSLKQRACSCKNTALHNPGSAFCQSFIHKWMLLHLDLTWVGAQLLFWLFIPGAQPRLETVWHLFFWDCCPIQHVRLVHPRNALIHQPHQGPPHPSSPEFQCVYGWGDTWLGGEAGVLAWGTKKPWLDGPWAWFIACHAQDSWWTLGLWGGTALVMMALPMLGSPLAPKLLSLREQPTLTALGQ